LLRENDATDPQHQSSPDFRLTMRGIIPATILDGIASVTF